MMKIRLSGIYRDPSGIAVAGATLKLTSVFNTSQTQLSMIVKSVTDSEGAYSFDLVPDTYSVSVIYGNGQQTRLGKITLFADSPAGTLNEYLTSFRPDLLQPGILDEMQGLLTETKQAEAGAERAADKAEEAARTSGLHWCDEYDPEVTYGVNDAVLFDNDVYICLQTSTGNQPDESPAYWDLMVPGGKDGDAGPPNTLIIGTVTTLNADEEATADIEGEAPNQTLNLGIPKGADGGSLTVDGKGADETGNIPLGAYTAENPPPFSVPVLGAPGQSAMLWINSTSAYAPGHKLAGSILNYGGIGTSGPVYTNSHPAGTWMLQGATVAGSCCTVWVRVDMPAAAGTEGTLQLFRESSDVRNCRYSAADNSLIDCEINQNGTWLPFTASPTDCTEWGREIYGNAVAGEYGEVTEF